MSQMRSGDDPSHQSIVDRHSKVLAERRQTMVLRWKSQPRGIKPNTG
jgi:hypothetical protein